VLELDEGSLKLLDPETGDLLNSQQIHAIRQLSTHSHILQTHRRPTAVSQVIRQAVILQFCKQIIRIVKIIWQNSAPVYTVKVMQNWVIEGIVSKD
jgi:hypothetical protein